ncbi:DUF1803 domain-containing protein [Streptococcus iniae]|uniref:DUF1803 domain-containing protein n=1 Tax=Streptococcus iniae TaxID=1346 RepID=UPI0008D92A26|nr:DUF1803 domain-containing protein [Streptococcus iniae]OHX27555.1 hypothetical protein BKX95_04545 [Streptococcus iniae]RLV27357.1 DUF1803 domain-containing protein [Streptococcus iniae]
MLIVINPDKLTQTPFFQQVINFLWDNEDVTLRHIKKAFLDVEAIDKHIEAFVRAGYIIRSEKRYYLKLPLNEEISSLELDQMMFCDDCSDSYHQLMALEFETCLKNSTNDLLIFEKTDFQRRRLSLSNYFSRLTRGQAVSDEQKPLFDLLGDVNEAYAMKYLTTFLAKFLRKDIVMQKRPDIFCQALVLLGYIEEVESTKYKLTMALDKEKMSFYAK